jgi:hypothetical protein
MRYTLTTLLLLSLSAATPAAAQGSCRVAETLPEPLSAVPAPELNALFDLRGPGWTGGDSTYSLPLPDGRVLWLFSDTFLGVVDERGGRNRFSPMVNNTLVVQDGETLTTLHGGDPTLPGSFFPSPTGGRDDWYWVYDASIESTAEGDKLRVFLLHFRRAGGGIFGFEWQGNALATVSLHDLELEGITPVTAEGGVSWGAAVMETPTHTYVYGTEDHGDDKYMHLARAPKDGLTGPWEFWDGAGWSSDPAASARVLHGVANEYSVAPHAGGYVLVTMDTSTTFSPDLVAYTACDPQGPWENKTLLYRTPETGQGDLITYNAHAHPHLADESGWVVSYNVNSRTLADLYRDASIYRPRFVRVPITQVEDR